MNTPTVLVLPRAAPRRVLAFGAWLKNSAGLLEGDRFLPSALHGDLGTPEACIALERSVQALAAAAGGPIEAVAHDLHPDFHSTRLALHWAERLGVPAIGVQHHQAHLAVLQAEAGLADGPLLGLALDGVGLGTDGTAWGGELLRLDAHGGFERLESEYRALFARNLTLSRLSEAVILPLCPDKGSCMEYDENLAASVYLENDLETLWRMKEFLIKG